MAKLTTTQQNMVDRLRSSGGMEIQPMTGSRESVVTTMDTAPEKSGAVLSEVT